MTVKPKKGFWARFIALGEGQLTRITPGIILIDDGLREADPIIL